MYDQVLEFIETREPVDNSIAHVINLDIQDNLEEATIGAFLISDMCLMVRIARKIEKPNYHFFLGKHSRGTQK